jgi:hypothetical protein
MPLAEVESLGTSGQYQSREEAEASKQLKWFAISYDLLVDLLRQGENGRFVRIKGLPADAMILWAGEHCLAIPSGLAIKVWSSEFGTLANGDILPELTLECSLYQEEGR